MEPVQALPMTDRNREITALVTRERSRLATFIRRRVSDPLDAEDVLQDVLHDFVRAYRLPEPIEQAGAWLFRVARNRIIDRFRKRNREPAELVLPVGEDGERMTLEELLPSLDAGPEAAYARSLLIDALDEAIDELPDEQREVFIAHEIEGRSFKELAAETGLNVNTLLSRKHYAVLYLRQRLENIYMESTRLRG